jgi:hypothetical protein
MQEFSYSNALEDESQNLEGKRSGLENTMNKLEMELKNEENQKETLKKASEDLKLEQLEKKIQVICCVISLLAFSYRIVSYILSRLSPYVDEITGDLILSAQVSCSKPSNPVLNCEIGRELTT